MFVDQSPVPNSPTRKVIVIEEKDEPYTLLLVDEVIEKARAFGATSRDIDKNEIFWIVFAHKPRRLFDMTESALRDSLRRLKTERMQKEALIAMGGDALIGEILETFEFGNLGSFARKELPRVCRELELTTLGELEKRTRGEIRGPQCRYVGNKSLEYIDAVLREFGRPVLRYFEKA